MDIFLSLVLPKADWLVAWGSPTHRQLISEKLTVLFSMQKPESKTLKKLFHT